MSSNWSRNLKLEQGLKEFIDSLSGKNRSVGTIRAYKADLEQFINWLHLKDISIEFSGDVRKSDIIEYLNYLSQKALTGMSRARKLSAIREYFKYLDGLEYIVKSPTIGIETPKREKNTRTFLYMEEYNMMLSLAGSKPRDFAIIQVFLQTGIRVSELANLKIDDIDLQNYNLKVTGKGMVQRNIELEPKGVQAIKSWLNVRPQSYSDNLFLNYQGEPLSERGIRKIVTKYRKLSGITKKASCHSLRHTFGTYKVENGAPILQVQKWLGHANLNTTQIYVHMVRQNAKKIMKNTSL